MNSLSHLDKLFGLESKVAIITGAARGIGLGTAEALASAGAAVVLGDKNVDLAQASAEEIRKSGRQAAAAALDVADERSVKDFVDHTARQYGRLDIVINNAGIFPMKPVQEMEPALWDTVLAVNLRGVFLVTKYAAAHMIAAGAGGRIINVSSINTARTYVGMAHYDASKGGLEAFTRSTALEYAPYGITVNAIAAGAVKSPGAMANVEILARIGGGAAAGAVEEFAKKIPQGRWAEPIDIGHAVLCLTGAAAGYITGQTIYVDGGLKLGL